jgi:hypothetical protein
LLNTNNGNILDLVGGTSLVECGVNLTRADDDTLAFRWRDKVAIGVLWITENPVEVRVTGEFREVGASKWVTEESLREEEDERLAELSVHLTTEKMEQVGWSSWISNLHVAVLMLSLQLLWGWEDTRILVAELEVSLNSGRGVLWSLSIVTVWQRHNNAGSLEPLALTRGNELINDALSVVGKVTELSLPHDESIWGGERVSVLEAKGTKLGE